MAIFFIISLSFQEKNLKDKGERTVGNVAVCDPTFFYFFSICNIILPPINLTPRSYACLAYFAASNLVTVLGSIAKSINLGLFS